MMASTVARSTKATAVGLVRDMELGSQSSETDDDARALLDELGMSRQLGFMLRLAQLAYLDYVNSGPKIGLTHSHLLVLRMIGARPALTQQRIANALRIKKTNLAPIMAELVAQGLVVRKSSPDLPRAYAVYLTAKGERSVKKAKAIISKHMRGADGVLNENEREQLVGLLAKLAFELPARSGKSTRKARSENPIF